MNVEKLKENAFQNWRNQHASALSRPAMFGDTGRIEADRDFAALTAFFELPLCSGCKGTGGDLHPELLRPLCKCEGIGRDPKAFEKYEEKFHFDPWPYLAFEAHKESPRGE